MFDPQLYRDQGGDRGLAKKGPIERFQGWLRANGLIA